jgi:peptide/nickel transport system permease protein
VGLDRPDTRASSAREQGPRWRMYSSSSCSFIARISDGRAANSTAPVPSGGGSAEADRSAPGANACVPVTSAIPYFWVAMVLVLIFGITLHWFPSQGGYYVTTDNPGLNFTFFQDVINHAILPNLTGFAMSLGFVVSGAILIEYVFNYPGVGYMLLQAVSGEDYPLMQGLFLLITVTVLFAILVADILTALLDPRTRAARKPWPCPCPGVPAETPALQVPGGHALARVGRAIRSNRKATVGTVLLVIFILIALFPGVIAHDSPSQDAYVPQLGISAAHLLGTNHYGQDLFSQLVWGTRNVMIIALVVGLATTGIAVLIGVAAAYLGGLADSSMSVLTDVLLVIPLFPLLIVIAAYAHGGTTLVLIAAITLTSWSYTARQLRSQALTLRNRDFLEAARVRGERRLYIIVVEVIPAMTSLIVASFLTNALYAVLFASSLQFIGLGDPNTVSWGTTLYWAQNNAALQTGEPLWAIAPGACIAVLGAAFALLNYAFDEIGNPALRPVRKIRHKKGAGTRA